MESPSFEENSTMEGWKQVSEKVAAGYLQNCTNYKDISRFDRELSLKLAFWIWHVTAFFETMTISRFSKVLLLIERDRKS